MENPSLLEGQVEMGCWGTGLGALSALMLHRLPTPQGPALFRWRTAASQSYIIAAVTSLQLSALTKIIMHILHQ